MESMQAWIEFDIPQIVKLKIDYEATLECIIDELPDVNWNSMFETYTFFSNEYNICIDSLRISSLVEMKRLIEDNDDDMCEYMEHKEECLEVLIGLIEAKKLQWILRNYINNILKHNVGGVYPLRLVNGQWKMQNKRDLPYEPSIVECIISKSSNII